MQSWRELKPHTIARARGCILALLGATGAAALLRPQISSALVVRGDEMLYASQASRALAFYQRALLFNPDNEAAADRYAFISMTTHERIMLESAVRVSSVFLRWHPSDLVILMDRALCDQLLRRERAAELDFLSVALARRDARTFVFAGYAALRQGSRSRARHWWRMALMDHPSYVPALHALEHH